MIALLLLTMYSHVENTAMTASFQ